MSAARARRARLRLGVLVSGSGTNLQAILDACAKGKPEVSRARARADIHARSGTKRTIDAEVAVVISNRPEAFALARARRAGVPAVAVPPKEHADRDAYDAKLVEVLRAHRVSLVCLAGFMRLLSPAFIRAFPGRILNIHPALLPSFPGLDVQQKAIEHGVRFSGCTVHVVDEGCDTGPIVIQAVVPVAPGDTAATLAARILEQEHRIYPRAIQLFAEGRVGAPQGRRLRVRGAAWTDRALVNPPLTDGARSALKKRGPTRPKRKR